MGMFECKECGKQYTHYGNLQRHAKIHLLGPPTCHMCGKCFSQKRLLDRHLSVNTCSLRVQRKNGQVNNFPGTSRPHKCVECGRGFAKLEYLAAHTAAHMGGASDTTCELCGKHISRRSDMKRHYATHTGAKDFVCGVCGCAYRQKGDLNKHIRSSHGKFMNSSKLSVDFSQLKDEDIFPADVTDGRKRYRSFGSVRKYKCEECGSKFNRLDVLRNHYATHLTHKPFKCEECGKSYARKDVLTTHMQRHFRVREYTCEPCGKLFWDKSEIRQHMNIHLPPQFQCEECGKQLRSKVTLIHHLKRHTKI